VKAVHDKVQDLQCLQFSYSTGFQTDLRRHVKTVHDKVKDFKCLQCNFTTSRSCHMKDHRERYHSKEESAVAAGLAIHKLKVGISSELAHHDSLDPGGRPPEEQAEGPPETGQRPQEEAVEEPQEVTSEGILVRLPEKPPATWNPKISRITTVKSFQCLHCSYWTCIHYNIKAHVKAVHDKVKDFRCQQCNYASSRSSNLTTHMKAVHDKIKDFKCQQCSYSTSVNSNLKKHLKSVHAIEESTAAGLPGRHSNVGATSYFTPHGSVEPVGGKGEGLAERSTDEPDEELAEEQVDEPAEVPQGEPKEEPVEFPAGGPTERVGRDTIIGQEPLAEPRLVHCKHEYNCEWCEDEELTEATLEDHLWEHHSLTLQEHEDMNTITFP
jgi:hypothetical protein